MAAARKSPIVLPDFSIILFSMEQPGHSPLQTAKEDFRQAHKQATLEAIMARVQGQTADLLSYYDVYEQLKATGQSDRGLQEIPVAAIVGSVGRTNDFSRTFLPRNTGNEERWAGLLTVASRQSLDKLPPIQVYQIGDAYFVQDGHHRVSIARRQGVSHIKANVVQVHTRVPLNPDTRSDELIWRAEYAQFLEDSRLHEQRPDADLSVTVPGQYTNLTIHIDVHRYFLEMAQENPSVSIPWPEAVLAWYDQAYLPLVAEIRQHDLLRHFPGRTETDLYLWLFEHRLILQRQTKWDVPTTAAASDLARHGDPLRPPTRARQAGQRILHAVLPESEPETGQWRQERLLDRYSGFLFNNILALINGEETGWQVLEQAFTLAGREQAQIHGLHVLPDNQTAAAADTLIQTFDERCFIEGVSGRLAVAEGDLVETVIERAAMADLIVLALRDTQSEGTAAEVSSRIQQILRRAPRPVLVVTGDWSNLARPLLVYDRSAKAREALFVATYMAEQWRVPLALIAPAADREALDYAQRYLDMHELEAAVTTVPRLTADLIRQTAVAQSCDLLIKGGYRSRSLVTVVRGSLLNTLLSQTNLPLLICQ
jgi:nucleotide-binding universal stress UspA family protein